MGVHTVNMRVAEVQISTKKILWERARRYPLHKHCWQASGCNGVRLGISGWLRTEQCRWRKKKAGTMEKQSDL